MAYPTRAELDRLVAERLAADPEFRERLLTNPKAAVSALVGFDLPDEVSIEVHEESLTSVHLVIPTSTGAGDLTDQDLELVAGGLCWSNCCGTPLT